MELIIKILFTQFVIYYVILLSMHPSSSFSDWIEEKTGDYCKALDVICGFQLIAIIITLIVMIWTI